VEREGRLSLEVHEGAENRGDEEQQKRVVADDRPDRLAALFVSTPNANSFWERN